MSKSITALICVLFLCMACGENYLPKPKGYNRIDLPEFAFTTLEEPFPYRFEHSVHSRVEPDHFNASEPYWINLHYPEFGAKVHFTYQPIGVEGKSLRMVLEDAVNLTAQHQVKAYGIEERVLRTPHGYTGVVAELSGEVPTQFQFFVTDSTRHFLRGALYFETAVKNDSLSPVIEYIKVDMMHLMNTVQFNPK